MDVDEDDNSARAGKGKKKAASGKSLDDKVRAHRMPQDTG